MHIGLAVLKFCELCGILLIYNIGGILMRPVGRRNYSFRFALTIFALMCFFVSCLYDGSIDGAQEQLGASGSASAAASGQAGTTDQVEGKPIELDQPFDPRGNRLPEQTFETDADEYDAKVITEDDWANAIERILVKSAPASHSLNIMQGKTRGSSLKSKGEDGLRLAAEYGFRISIKSSDYSGENEVELSSIVTPNWTYQKTKTGRNFILYDDVYKDYEEIKGNIQVLYPAEMIEYLHNGVKYYANKDYNENGTAIDSRSVAGTWQYKASKNSDLKKIWKSDSKGASSIYDGLCGLLMAIKGSYDSAVCDEEGLTYELNGFVYLEKDEFESLEDEILCEVKLAFGDSAPESAKVIRPVKFVFGFNDNKELSLVSSSMTVGEEDELFILMSATYGNREMKIEYLDDFECTVEDLPASSLSELEN